MMNSAGRVKIDLYGNETCFIGDVEVTRAEFDARFPPKPLEEKTSVNVSADWQEPVHSLALAVTKKAIPEARDDLIKAGIPTDFTADGMPILRSKAHKERVMKHLGYHDKNSFK